MSGRPQQTAEGRLIQEAMARMGISSRKAGPLAGISDARWRHIVNGYQPIGRGEDIAVVAPPATLARMAKVVGVDADALREVGRSDAADELENLSGGATVVAEAARARADVPAASIHGVISAVRAILDSSALTDGEKVRYARRLIEDEYVPDDGDAMAAERPAAG